MAKTDILYIRRGNLILDDTSGDIKEYSSINQAKRASRELPKGSVQAQRPKKPGVPSTQPFFLLRR